MNQQSTLTLAGIPETMLITLWAKAIESQHKNPIIKDEKALELIQQIDYDFNKFKRSAFSQVGIATRAKLIDDETLAFINKHSQAIIIQIGAGLDTRFYRLGCPSHIVWYDIDVSMAMAYRSKLIAPQDNVHMLDFSMLDKEWVAYIQNKDLPILVIVEGVLMYFDESKVRQFFDLLCDNFNHLEVVFDMLYYKGVGNVKKTDAVSKTKDQPEYLWSMLNSREIERWHHKIHFVKEYHMSDYYGNRCPFPFNLLYKLPYFYKNFNQRIVKLELY